MPIPHSHAALRSNDFSYSNTTFLYLIAFSIASNSVREAQVREREGARSPFLILFSNECRIFLSRSLCVLSTTFNRERYLKLDIIDFTLDLRSVLL